MTYHFTIQQVRNLQRGTRAVLLFGIVTSISANVLHSLTRPEAASEPEWRLVAAAVLSAFAPLALFACTELVSRIPVHSKVLSVVRLVITFAVGGFAAWVSYWHMESVARQLGETDGTQYVYPLIIDGMMIVATISLIELGRVARSIRQAEEAARTPKVDSPQGADPKATVTADAPTERSGQPRRRSQPRRPRPRPRPASQTQPVAEPDETEPASPAPAGTSR